MPDPKADSSSWSECTDLGLAALKEEKFVQAEQALSLALQIAEEFDKTDTRLMESLENLARLYLQNRRFSAAEPLYDRALALREQAVGAEHLDIIPTLEYIAYLQRSQQKYDAAEATLKRCITIRENKLGLEHSDVADSVKKLASFYHYWYGGSNKDVDPEPLYRRALSIRQFIYGIDRPEIDDYVDGLGYYLIADKQYEQAEELYRQTLERREIAVGPNDAQLAHLMINLARALSEQEKDSTSLTDRTLALAEQLEPSASANVLLELGDYFRFREKQKQSMALKCYEKALAKSEAAPEIDAAQTLKVLEAITRMHSTSRDFPAAHHYERIIELREKHDGPDSTEYLKSLSALAQYYSVEERLEEAATIYEKVLIIEQNINGLNSANVANTLNSLAYVKVWLNDFETALTLFRRAESLMIALTRANGSFNSTLISLHQILLGQEFVFTKLEQSEELVIVNKKRALINPLAMNEVDELLAMYE